MAGVVRVRVGERVFPWAADHLEPGVSAGCRDRGRHQALQFLSGLGNRVRALSGAAAGAEGVVVGKHAFVLVDFDDDALERLAPGDRLLVHARCQGLRLLDFPEILPRSCGPELLDALPLSGEARLRVEVAYEIPAYLMGAGLGMSSEWANCDVMFTRRETVEQLGFEELRLGDVVAMHDQDHRFGRGFRRGFTAIGVVAHGGHGSMPGHGVGVVTIMSGPAERFELVRVERANVREYLA